ncbi:MAG: LysE family translocator [Synergistaceae bacterium]|nr:LysE family translocator [Synergistaceae bacterium]
MMGIVNFGTFLAAGILLNLTPGNDTIFVLSKSMAQGRRAGIVSALGISSGCAVHTMLAALGLSAIISKSIILFNAVKYAGAAYLLYVGWKTMRDRTGIGAAISGRNERAPYLEIYRDALLTNVLNPKVALFFLAFLPQFVAPDTQDTFLPFLILGFVFVATGTIWCFTLAVLASFISERLKNNVEISRVINKICGAVLIVLGIKVALTDK